MRILAAVLFALLPASVQAAIPIQGGAAAEHPATGLVLDSHIGWIDDGAVFLDGRSAKRALSEDEAAFDRGALLDGAIARAKAEGKLVLWYIPRIIESSSRGRQMYRAPILDIYARQVLFCDEDVSALIASSFVPLRMVCDDAMAQRFEFRPLEYIEPAFFFIDGEGQVVHLMDRVRTFDALWFAGVLERVLDKARIELPERELGDSEIDGVLAEAAMFRRERDPEGALEALDVADELITASKTRDGQPLKRNDPRRSELREAQGRIALERGRLLTMMGKREEARSHLDIAWRAKHSEAGYFLALNRLATGDEVGAQRQFQLVAQRYPESLAGRRAVANITLGPDDRPIGAAFAGFEHVGYLPESAYVGLPRDTNWAGEPLNAHDMAVLAVRYLLQAQRGDGGFTDSRYAYWGSSSITPNTWVAISALATTALLESRDLVSDVIDVETIDAAILRGETYLFDPKNLNRGQNEDVYSDAFRVLYLTRRANKWPDELPGTMKRLDSLITEACARQSESGFFAHEYKNAFCTGVMLWALIGAKDLGIVLPEGTLERGSAALNSARGKNAAYSYSGTAARSATLKDAAGRMPVCEAVLLRTGSGSDARLAFALDNFWEYYERLATVRRNDFHSDGELAGFFFYHDLYTTSESFKLAPEAAQPAMRKQLYETLIRLPEIDGSFVDSHEIGRSYGSAMALLVLMNVMEE